MDSTRSLWLLLLLSSDVCFVGKHKFVVVYRVAVLSGIGIHLLRGWVVALVAIACGAALYSLVLRVGKEQSTMSNSLGATRGWVPLFVGMLCILGIIWQYKKNQTYGFCFLSSGGAQGCRSGQYE
jgi:hypothetical protein